jgi:hypothetical protein
MCNGQTRRNHDGVSAAVVSGWHKKKIGNDPKALPTSKEHTRNLAIFPSDVKVEATARERVIQAFMGRHD